MMDNRVELPGPVRYREAAPARPIVLVHGLLVDGSCGATSRRAWRATSA